MEGEPRPNGKREKMGREKEGGRGGEGVLGRERERGEHKMGKKTSDRVKIDQYLQQHMSSKIVIAKKAKRRSPIYQN